MAAFELEPAEAGEGRIIEAPPPLPNPSGPVDLESALAELREADPLFRRFGANRHRYALNPVALEEQVIQFEARHGVRLPEDYRAFLMRFGNGGAGPCYGLYSLAEVDEELLGPWPEDERPFLDRPFPTPANLPVARNIGYPADGMVPLAHIGCGQMFLLGITGPERGHIWSFNNDDAYHPYTREISRCPSEEPWGEREARIERFCEAQLADPKRVSFWQWYADWVVGVL